VKKMILGLGLWILVICWLVTGMGAGAWANEHSSRRQSHQSEKTTAKKQKKKHKKKIKKDEDEESVAAISQPQPRPDIDPESLLSRAREEEKGGDIDSCLKTLSKFINLYPQHPQRPATLFRMARLTQENRQTDRALHLYALVASLYPDSQLAGEARWQTSTLGFYGDLRLSNPLACFKNYLLKNAALAAGVAPEKLREPLLRGWQTVARAVREQSPCPVNLVEEVLTLWELAPEGTQPPEAALLVGELLQEQGLYGEARTYLQQAREQGSPAVRTQALVGQLEGSWATRDLYEFAATWVFWRRHPVEVTPALHSRLEKLPLPQGFFSGEPGGSEVKKVDEEPVAVLLDWWSGKALDGSRLTPLIQCLQHFLRSSLPGSVQERLKQQLAQLRWSQGEYAQAAKIYRELLAAPANHENSSFYQDRLALSQLHAQHPEAAVQIYQGMGQERDHMWQLLSRTRLADLELARVQTEPAQ
jgi:tetratricopeptide (TPR) repeat protein